MSEQSKSDLLKQKEKKYKNIALEYFKLVSMGKFKEGLRFFASDCKTHNPFVSGSIEKLTDAMIAASKDLDNPSLIIDALEYGENIS